MGGDGHLRRAASLLSHNLQWHGKNGHSHTDGDRRHGSARLARNCERQQGRLAELACRAVMRVRVVRLGDSGSAWSVIMTVRMIVMLMTMRGPVIERIVHEVQQPCWRPRGQGRYTC